MINNGEGNLETELGPTFPYPCPSFPSKSDGADAPASPGTLSNYSSCGESEFERYCSANSAMGTPSSYGPVESEFGSMRSLENFSLGGGFDRNLEDRQLSNSLKRGVEQGMNIKNETSGLELCDDEGSIRDGVGMGLDSVAGAGEGLLGQVGSVENDGWLNALESEMGLGFDGREMGHEEDGTSSRYEHSDGDDSMYGSGSDDENRKNLCVQRSLMRYSEEAKAENENPLVINSFVAFGSDDWDDFEQETGGGILDSMTLDKIREKKEHNVEMERHLFSSAPVASIGVPVGGYTKLGKDETEEPAGVRQLECDELVAVPITSPNAELEQAEEVRDIPLAGCQIRGAYELPKDDESNSIMQHDLPSFCKVEQEDVREISVTCNQAEGANDTTEHFKSFYVNDDFEMEQDPLVEKTLVRSGLKITDFDKEGEHLCVKSEEIICADDRKAVVNQQTKFLEVEADPLSDTTSQLCSRTEYSVNASAELPGDQKSNSTQSIIESNASKTQKNDSASVDHFENEAAVKAESFELNEFYAEIVNEMEEILLDSGKSPGARFPQGSRIFQSQPSLPLRDGGSTASTSGTNTNDAYPLISQPLRIDGVEVVGAKQKKGDVSFSERLVGVKEYTVYIIRVWSGKDQWEVERRYRDFFTLYRRLKSLFDDQGCTLPSPWSLVEKESRKIFGNASPNVVSERSVLIQECLRSIIHSGLFSSLPSALVWFLCPQDSFPASPASRTEVPWSIFSNRGADTDNISTLGKTISLIVEIWPYESTKQMLEAQHYTCAGCHKHFDDGMTLMRDFVQTLGWGKPRLCEYTGQLFCSSCHSNETAVLPARVLHYWDFTQYPVSQLAKSYLDSIYEQPMLCVSAVNPFLFSKVPALHHVMGVRKKIGTLLPYVHCPFRMSINKGLGSRRYLLESNDFFALRDLIDLSKGAFAALPVMLQNVLRKILEHITEQCLICCDVGVPCSARQVCDDPSSLIFPFQEDEIEKCTSCESVFHKRCFRKLTNCSCGAHIAVDEIMRPTNELGRMASSGLLGRRSSTGLPIGLLSGLFSKAKAENIKDHKDRSTVILMGSLPSTSL